MRNKLALAVIILVGALFSVTAHSQPNGTVRTQIKSPTQAVTDTARIVRRLSGYSMVKLRNKFKRRSNSLLNPSATQSVSFACPKQGTAQVSGEITTDGKRPPKQMSVDAVATLDNCNGIGGSLNFDGSVAFSSKSGTLGETLSGTLEGQCTGSLPLTLTSDISLTGNVNVESLAANGSITGTMTGSCGPLSITCTWDQVRLSDIAAVKAGCGL